MLKQASAARAPRPAPRAPRPAPRSPRRLSRGRRRHAAGRAAASSRGDAVSSRVDAAAARAQTREETRAREAATLRGARRARLYGLSPALPTHPPARAQGTPGPGSPGAALPLRPRPPPRGPAGVPRGGAPRRFAGGVGGEGRALELSEVLLETTKSHLRAGLRPGHPAPAPHLGALTAS